MSRHLLLIAISLLVTGSTTLGAEERPLKIESEVWGQTADGRNVHRFTLTNASGHSVEMIDWGATLVAVRVPDRDGKIENVVLGFERLEGYLQRHPYFGSTVGRFCNRIGGARFTLDGTEYRLAANLGETHIHGGKVGFDAQLWDAETFENGETIGIRFRLVSPDGQEGYPGTLEVVAEYSWNNQNELAYTFTATTDKPTVVNLTNHVYWNLAGAGNGLVRDHRIEIEADQVLDVDATLVPTGKLNEIADTPLDFRTSRAIGESIDQLPETKGYDHCYVVRGKKGTLRAAARVIDPQSGRIMDVRTTQPGMQLYTGNHLAGNDSSAGFGQHSAFCLETQHYPDAPNKPDFPSTRLDPDQTMSETTVHVFSTE
ncbi:aldose epimerase family protein [Candidatus Laterigemmans baculatus]|uniref:aldose epimerase family protein n=1 Tax=Candidatus Laterigemmans baculatus TaxID=2770505 RepID=UPI0013DC4F09|nr:aldose epimerase family protein [Candidatus Laterigemmans baculatus]